MKSNTTEEQVIVAAKNREYNVSQIFIAAAKEFPDRTAIIDRDGTKISFGELRDDVLRMAAYYRSKGISKGDRVLIFVPMGIPLYRNLLALFHIGAVAVFLDEWVSKERFEECCRLARCKALIAPRKIRMLGWLSKEIRRIPVWLGVDCDMRQKFIGNNTPTYTNDTALITFTTGSTGIPKAADRTHGFLQAQFEALIDKVKPHEDDIDMPVLPIVLLLNLGTGVTSVVADYNSRKPESINPRRLWEQIVAHKVNRLSASPHVVEQLAGFDYGYKHPLRIFTGGAAVFPSSVKVMQRGLPGSTIEIIYGSTEAEPISGITAQQLSESDISLENGLPVGLPYHGTRVLIIPVSDEPVSVRNDEELFSRTLSANQVGEIIVAGKHVLEHYIENPAAEHRNKIVTADSVWHRTGDAGFINNSGELYLCGRCSALITTPSGDVLAPFLWEGWFKTVPGVRIGTVLQVKNTIVAIVEIERNCDKEAISQLILRRYPFDAIRFMKIPRDPRHYSKVDYKNIQSD